AAIRYRSRERRRPRGGGTRRIRSHFAVTLQGFPRSVLLLLAVAGLAKAAARPPCTVTLPPGADVQRAVDGAAVVCLGPGQFVLRRFLLITRDGRVLRGAGPSTVLRLENGVQSPVVVIGDPEHPVPRRPTANVTIERLAVVGGGADGPEMLP